MRRIVLLIVLAAVLVMGGMPAAAQEDNPAPVFVLVHGAFQTSAGWDGVMAALEAQGATVIAVNSPGRGDDMTPAAEQTLDAYRDAVIAVIEQQNQPVILVGHSFGGMVVSAVAEAIPDKIATVVYLAAFLPLDGESLLALVGQNRAEDAGLITPTADQTLTFAPEAFAAAFCPECTPEQAEVLAASRVDEPLPPLNQPVTLTAENFGAVRKVYILTAQDLVVPPAFQAYMLSRTPVDKVYAIDAGHAPYISQPEALANILWMAAAS